MSTPTIAQYQRRLRPSTAGVPAGSGKDWNAAAAPPTCRNDPPPGPELSHREIEVLGYLPTMLTAGEIADELWLSVHTVKAHLRSIYSKLGVSRRRAAVDLARRRGIL
jgi:LuxR family maltose regulon positive regulatory protein